jgi:hypothetical protein
LAFPLRRAADSSGEAPIRRNCIRLALPVIIGAVPNLMPSEIKADVMTVLQEAATGRGEVPRFLTAYQILARLPEAIRARLHSERGAAGEGGGHHFSAARAVSMAGELLHHEGLARIEYWDTGGVTFTIAGQPDAPAAFEVCALFQAVTPPEPSQGP